MNFEELPFIADRKFYWLEVSKMVCGPLWAEFGVATGRSCVHWLKQMGPDEHLWAFDSWKGLPEPWDLGRKVMPKGTFSGKVPHFLLNNPRVTVVMGWFEDTLPYDFGDPLDFVHIDCDLYSSAATVLERIEDFVKPGTVLAFDEIWNWNNKYPTWEQGEWKAYQEWKERTGRDIDWKLATVGGAVGVVI